MNPTTRKVDLMQFVLVWQGATRVGEVADKFDITESSARSRAATLRKHGVELKALPSPRKDRYVELAQAAKEAEKEAVTV